MQFFLKLKRHLYLIVARYFRFFANLALKRWRPRLIIVTGSAGKTTMLNLIAAQLGQKAHYSFDANSAFGIPFDILGLSGVTNSRLHWLTLFLKAPWRAFSVKHPEKFYVVELDAPRPHTAEFIASWLKPEVSIWVSLGRSHAVFFEDAVKKGLFKDVDSAIAHEFACIPQHTQKLVIFDGDNPNIKDALAKLPHFKTPLLSVQKNQLLSYSVTPAQTTFVFKDHTLSFHDPIPASVATQLLMLKALLSYLKLPLDPSFKDFIMPPGRGSFFKGKRNLKLIDSTYNAHLISMSATLEMFRQLKAKSKWLVIGDIIDQGSSEATGHQKLAELIQKAKPDHLVLVGKRTHRYTFPALQDAKFTSASFIKPQDALKYLEQNLQGGETVLFKGSQYLEWLVEKLLKDPRDAQYLTRRDAFHTRQRAKWGLK